MMPFKIPGPACLRIFVPACLGPYRRIRFAFVYLLPVILASCGKHLPVNDSKKDSSGKGIPFNGHITSLKSVPDSTRFHNEEIIKAGEPEIIAAQTNIYPAGNPSVSNALSVTTNIEPANTEIIALKTPAKKTMARVAESITAGKPYAKDINPFSFTSFNTLQGLRHNNIKCLLQDKKGNIWMGTGDGLSCYNGRTFTHYTPREGLPHNIILCLKQDNNDHLWIGTEGGGLVYFDGKYFTTYTTDQGLSDNVIMDLALDEQGRVWAATANGGINVFNGNTFTHYNTKNGLGSNTVYKVICSSQGNVWLGTGSGLEKISNNTITRYSTEEGNSKTVYSLLEDREKNIWMGTWEDGLFCFDGQKIKVYTAEQGLSSNTIISLFQDNTGNIWAGTYDHGINCFDGKNFTHYTQAEGLSDNEGIWSILQDHYGTMWLGSGSAGLSRFNGRLFTHYFPTSVPGNSAVQAALTDSKGNMWFGTAEGIYRYDGEFFMHYTLPDANNTEVWSLFEDRDGNIWIGAGRGAYMFDGKSFAVYGTRQGMTGNSVMSINQDAQGHIWMGTYDGGAVRFDGEIFTFFNTEQGLASNIVWAIEPDKKGRIWLGTANGISIFDGRNFTRYTIAGEPGCNEVFDLMQDSRGRMWVATNGGGVNCITNGVSTAYSTAEGLSHEKVSALCEQKDGKIWMATAMGIGCFDEKKTNGTFFKNYLPADGFIGIACTHSMAFDGEDKIWTGTNACLTAYHITGDHTDTTGPVTHLSGPDLYNETIAWGTLEQHKDSIPVLKNGIAVETYDFDSTTAFTHLPVNLSLAYYNNYITFNFTGIATQRPHAVRYRYVLEGPGNDPGSFTEKNYATYGNLAPGNYAFRLNAFNSEGFEGPGLTYRFSIRPPWWQTTWFRVMAALFALLLLYVLYRWRTASLIRRQRQLEKTVDERTAEVVEQKNEANHQRHLVEEKQKEITDSINYARRIQFSLLANEALLNQHLPDHFMLFMPKDIVSGDFYWAALRDSSAQQTNKELFLAVCDSTGHGVPGAFMSLLNISFLNEAVNEKNISEPGHILDHVRTRLIENMEDGKDGMDAILVCLDGENPQRIKYAAANNKPVIVRNNEIIELTCDKMPVGKGEKDQRFSTHTIDLEEGDTLYIYTDGFADQFGGPKGKKFKYSNLNHLLVTIHRLPFDEQKKILEEEFKKWKGELEQIDDVTIAGLRVGNSSL